MQTCIRANVHPCICANVHPCKRASNTRQSTGRGLIQWPAGCPSQIGPAEQDRGARATGATLWSKIFGVHAQRYSSTTPGPLFTGRVEPVRRQSDFFDTPTMGAIRCAIIISNHWGTGTPISL